MADKVLYHKNGLQRTVSSPAEINAARFDGFVHDSKPEAAKQAKADEKAQRASS